MAEKLNILLCEDDENLGFDMSNMNKRFTTINLKSEKGNEVMDKLLAEADVFVTNTRTKALVKLGYDYETLKAKYPKLIFAQILGYGMMRIYDKDDKEHIHQELNMAPGTVHDKMYDSEGNYPWHEYKSVTPCVYCPIELDRG